MPSTNRQLRLAQRPTGMVDDDTFDLVEEPLRELADGEFLVRAAYLSIDPTNRVWIREEPSYLPPCSGSSDGRSTRSAVATSRPTRCLRAFPSST